MSKFKSVLIFLLTIFSVIAILGGLVLGDSLFSIQGILGLLFATVIRIQQILEE